MSALDFVTLLIVGSFLTGTNADGTNHEGRRVADECQQHEWNRPGVARRTEKHSGVLFAHDHLQYGCSFGACSSRQGKCHCTHNGRSVKVCWHLASTSMFASAFASHFIIVLKWCWCWRREWVRNKFFDAKCERAQRVVELYNVYERKTNAWFLWT